MKLFRIVAIYIAVAAVIVGLLLTWSSRGKSITVVGSVGEIFCIVAGPECNKPILSTDDGTSWLLKASDSQTEKILEYRDKRIKVHGRIIHGHSSTNDRIIKVASFEPVQ